MSRFRVAVLDDFESAAETAGDWSAVRDVADVDIFSVPIRDERDLVTVLSGYDIVSLMRERTAMPADVLRRLPNLKMLCVTGGRNTAVDFAACESSGVRVCGTRPAAAGSAAELSWALIMAGWRGAWRSAQAVRLGDWTAPAGRTLQGRTLGVIGLGPIGSQVARYGRAFGMRVVAWNRRDAARRATDVGAESVGWKDMFTTSDIVTLHLRLTDQTVGMVGVNELAMMQSHALLVNTSRGPICDETALVRALKNGTIGGAALDVFGTESLPQDSPFRTLPNVVATPHVGYVTVETLAGWYADVAENIVAFARGEPVRVVV